MILTPSTKIPKVKDNWLTNRLSSVLTREIKITVDQPSSEIGKPEKTPTDGNYLC